MAAAADLIILEEVLNKLHPLVESGKFVRAYKKQLRKFQLNLAISLAYLKEIANSEKRVDVIKEIKKEVMYIVLVAEHDQLLDHQHSFESSTGPSSPGDGVHFGCMNGTLWVSVHQYLMARRLCKLNRQFRKLKHQLVGIGEDILMEQLSDFRQELSDFRQGLSDCRQQIALIIIACYAVAHAFNNILIEQSLALSMQQRSLIQQQIEQIMTQIYQLNRIQQRIERSQCNNVDRIYD